ncbi:MAG TPA: Wzz/FepE/Etk N-terminal domain-containing protein [Alphaproteobacteria bacterium]|nr:Wzz/FepE/Etk N-terminal domain-containing protein [Alphaproteobacteria bacterium]
MGALQLLAILWARRTVVIGCFASTVLLAVAVTLILPKSYQAKVTVLVDNEARNAYTNDFETRGFSNDFLGKQVAIVTSNRTAKEVVDELNLAQNQRFAKAYAHTRQTLPIEDWIAAYLTKAVVVTPQPDQSSIEIAYRSPDAATAAKVANAFADAYMRTGTDIRVGTAEQTAIELRRQAQTLQGELAEAEKALHQYQQRTGIVETENGLDTEMRKLDGLQKLQTDTNTATEAARAQLTAFRSAKAAGQPVDQLQGVSSDELLKSLRSQLADVNTNLALTKGKFGTQHPDYIAGSAKKVALEHEIQVELDSIEAGFAAAVATGQQKAGDLDKAIADQKQRVVQLQTHWDQYQILINQVKTKRAELDQTVARSGQEAIESRVSTVSAVVLSPADPPAKPNFPNLLLNTALAIGFGGFFGLVMAVLVELFDRRIRSAEDFEDAAGAPVIVVMPKRAA